MRLFLIFIFALTSFNTFSQTVSSYDCKFTSVLSNDRVEENITLSKTPVTLRRVMAGKKHFFDFQMFEDGQGIQFLQYMEGIIEYNNTYLPQASMTTHIVPNQKSIYLGTFICGNDATCWALDCKLSK